MAEMGPVARWFVNHFRTGRNGRRYDWFRAHLTLPPEAVCLEVGCGNGAMAARIVDGMAPARFVATDLDLVQMAEARRFVARWYGGHPPSGLEFRPADMTRLPFPDAGFDAVFAFMSLHHAGADHHDPSRLPDALVEIDRVLRPGGALAYEEFRFTDRLRAWLADHGYRLEATEHHWRTDRVVAQKPAGPGPAPASATAPPTGAVERA
jgi:ubiquinone/menaquinone biosynthesis C-methylase UbiE